MVAAGPREVRHHRGRSRVVADLGERGKGEWKRILMVFVVEVMKGVGF